MTTARPTPAFDEAHVPSGRTAPTPQEKSVRSRLVTPPLLRFTLGMVAVFFTMMGRAHGGRERRVAEEVEAHFTSSRVDVSDHTRWVPRVSNRSWSS